MIINERQHLDSSNDCIILSTRLPLLQESKEPICKWLLVEIFFFTLFKDE